MIIAEIVSELLPAALAAVCAPLGRVTLKLGSFGRYRGGTAAGEAAEVLVGVTLCGVALIVAFALLLQHGGN